MSLFFMGPVVVPSPQAGPRAPLPCFLSPARCHIMPPTSAGHVSCRSPAPPFSLYVGAPGRTTPPPRFLRHEATHQIPICKPSELNAPFFSLSTPLRASLLCVLAALKSHVVVHQGPLPHAGFGSEHCCRLPHPVSSTLLCISSSIGALLTLPFPPRCRRNCRSPPPSTGDHRRSETLTSRCSSPPRRRRAMSVNSGPPHLTRPPPHGASAGPF
jgi:hypothetical protein